MMRRLVTYDPEKINNYVIYRSKLTDLFEKMVHLDRDARSELPGLEKGRADIICTGTLILMGIMDVFNFETSNS